MIDMAGVLDKVVLQAQGVRATIASRNLTSRLH